MGAGETTPRAPRTRRTGRGRLSSVDMLGDECAPDIQWALAALRARDMPQSAILAEFNARLADRGVAGISKGAFSRWSLTRAAELQRMDGARALMDMVAQRIGSAERSDGMIAAVELVKYRILEMVVADDAPNPKFLLNAALTLQRLSATAAREAEGQRREARGERDAAEHARAEEARAAEKAAAAIGDAGRSGVVTAETLAEINRLLGAV